MKTNNLLKLFRCPVELKWKIIPKDVDIGVGHDAQLECDAIGSPQPTIEWRKLTDGRRNGNYI